MVDDERFLKWFSYAAGKGKFHELGAPRQITGVVDMGNGDTRPVRLVETETDADGHRVAKVAVDEHGDITDAVSTWDNPSPATGRALMDQALHKWIQVFAGAAVATAASCWLNNRRK